MRFKLFLLNRFNFLPVLFLIVSLFSQTENTQAHQKIKEVKSPVMRLAGKQTFFIKQNSEAKQVEWWVDRQEIDEKNNKVKLTKNIQQATGNTITFDLPKISGKETIYFVHSKIDNTEETRLVRVFQPEQPSVFTYKSEGNPDVKNFIFIPKSLNPQTNVVVVMSGLQRNAEEYLDSWKGWAAANDYIVVSPFFDDENWKGARSYNLGNVFTENEGKGELNPKAKWSFTLVDDIQKTIHQDFSLTNPKFDLFGHSAGAQFVHRFLLFCPNAEARFAIAANAGWYTLPDLNKDFSYGLKNPLLTLNEKDVIEWTNKRLVIMRGTDDTERDEVLRKTSEAEAQGENRFERAAYMFARAKSLNPKTNWQLIDVRGVNHDQQKMAVAAQKFLEKNNK